MLFVDARQRWEEGARRVAAADPARRATLERIGARVLEDLHRRLGGPFDTDELAELYGRGLDWCLLIAVEEAPDDPDAWSEEAADAAFWRYAREAGDFAGGRRLGPS
ncbi:MAG: hypothetical protein QOK31_1029 [Solirubrobacteraceae bacterium]|nr:hypothetical protein [Solirubrobacteraceae bacterium]